MLLTGDGVEGSFLNIIHLELAAGLLQDELALLRGQHGVNLTQVLLTHPAEGVFILVETQISSFWGRFGLVCWG